MPKVIEDLEFRLSEEARRQVERSGCAAWCWNLLLTCRKMLLKRKIPTALWIPAFIALCAAPTTWVKWCSGQAYWCPALALCRGSVSGSWL